MDDRCCCNRNKVIVSLSALSVSIALLVLPAGGLELPEREAPRQKRSAAEAATNLHFVSPQCCVASPTEQSRHVSREIMLISTS